MKQSSFTSTGNSIGLVDEHRVHTQCLAGADILHGVLKHHRALRGGADGVQDLLEGLWLWLARWKYVLYSEDHLVRHEGP
eukprot:CAMPEP_0181402282 /NCGR_PEP_ID=MMETSP1110-20121109/3094_1 /TAXON_ID=174948 /ORGANISM="Symbiodinium sp., Strain CCMP421" /LENGTH=79 /DNA_ID=CAMNT_0023524495 /DNA_START=78 /DNA_END=317 /DNA_ORIENTATION=+